MHYEMEISEFAETFLEPFLKSTLGNLFLVGFKHLKPLCAALYVIDGRV